MNTAVTYDDRVVAKFLFASVLWGAVGMLVGLFVATLLAFHDAGLGQSWLSYGRLRPLHTNAVIFAFVGNMIFAGIYYSLQRLLKARMASDALSQLHFWGWQAIIVAAAITLPLGITQSKEYAELEWPIDLAVVVVWVAFAVNVFWTIAKRREKHLYVAIWFYLATIVTVAILYIVNNLALPVFGGALKSYSAFAGVQDALVQWWYGHNAVAFFLTTPVLGIMYYFLPKAADRPVYSYRLSIVHFWALVFMYIWAGPHHLLFTALPEWAQSMGMLFSLMLWAPSWGGMLNGLLTLRGAWHKVRTDPVLKFFVAGVTFYGMATFEGPLLSIKSVSGLAHYTDWIVGHVHSGALGWNGFMAAGMFYWLVPRLYGVQLKSNGAADAHFWTATIGILLYAVAMWISGVTQGLMWRATTADGALLYPNFVETLIAIRPMYLMRIVGGSLYLFGFGLMIWNLVATARAGRAVVVTVHTPELERRPDEPTWRELLLAKPVFVAIAAVALCLALFVADASGFVLVVVGAVALAIASYVGYALTRRADGSRGYHQLLEGRPLVFTSLTILAVLVGGVVELVPTIVAKRAVPTGAVVAPYAPLEIHGRDVYVREGCFTCHSQMIRPLLDEKLRYGPPSTAGESHWDRPFQWGSKRTGPDLARLGGKYPDVWHWQHMMDPRALSPGSNMPAYTWLSTAKVDFAHTAAKMHALATLGTPYAADAIAAGPADAEAHARAVAAGLANAGVTAAHDSELVALIAYLQRLGKPNGGPPDDGAPVAAR